MAATAWKYYDTFLEAKNDGTLDLDTSVIKMALYLSTSNCETLSLTTVASITNEHSDASTGYTAGGITMTPTITGGSQTVKWDLTNDAVWTAGSAGLAARYAVLYSGTTPIAWSQLDTSDVTASQDNTLTVSINANGVFNEAPAA